MTACGVVYTPEESGTSGSGESTAAVTKEAFSTSEKSANATTESDTLEENISALTGSTSETFGTVGDDEIEYERFIGDDGRLNIQIMKGLDNVEDVWCSLAYIPDGYEDEADDGESLHISQHFEKSFAVYATAGSIVV